MLSDLSILALVPARSGSKGLPDKNIRLLAGRTLIDHVGACLASLDWVDARVLSTDSERYGDVGRAAGLDVPFLRPAEFAEDRSSAVDVARHAILACEEHYGRRFDILLLLEPTSPLRRPEHVTRAATALVKSDAQAVVTVSPLDAHYHPDKVLKLGGDGLLRYNSVEGASIVARQQLSPLLIRNGVCYAVRRETILEIGSFFPPRTIPEVIEEPVPNIDDEHDFRWAELLLDERSS